MLIQEKGDILCKKMYSIIVPENKISLFMKYFTEREVTPPLLNYKSFMKVTVHGTFPSLLAPA